MFKCHVAQPRWPTFNATWHSLGGQSLDATWLNFGGHYLNATWHLPNQNVV